jgi:glycosyltransferase involved in cell wall biosynthesis
VSTSLPFLSIIIAHLNQPEYLLRCLRSLQEQDYPRDRYEIIVVDNGSASPPRDVVARFDNTRLEIELTPGPGPARNKGAHGARGDVLAFIDSDEFAHAQWLRAIGVRFAASSDRIVLGGDVRIACDNPQRPTLLEAYESVFAYRQQEYIEKQGFSGTGNLAVRRADFFLIGPFGGIDVSEDRAWGREARARGFRIVYVPGMVVFTPARRSFGELGAKWDRHILHDYEDWRRNGRGRHAWYARAAAVLASSVVDLRRVFHSTRISGLGARVKAMRVLARIRLYRAGAMIRVAARSTIPPEAHFWNRQPQR